jgi:hypothetical protein
MVGSSEHHKCSGTIKRLRAAPRQHYLSPVHTSLSIPDRLEMMISVLMEVGVSVDPTEERDVPSAVSAPPSSLPSSRE